MSKPIPKSSSADGDDQRLVMSALDECASLERFAREVALHLMSGKSLAPEEKLSRLLLKAVMAKDSDDWRQKYQSIYQKKNRDKCNEYKKRCMDKNREHYQKVAKEYAKAHPEYQEQERAKIKKMNNKSQKAATQKGQIWGDVEDDYLLKNYKGRNSAMQIAKYLGRTYSAVVGRYYKLSADDIII